MTIDSQASYDDKNLDVETENYLNSSAPEICDDIRWRLKLNVVIFMYY